MCRARRAHTADWPRPALTSCAADDGPATGPVSHNPTSTRGEDGRVTERDGTPVPGLTVPDVTRQLTWRVLGPLKGRAKSVLDWAGLRGEPPKTFQEAGRTYFVTGRTVAHRVRRVAAEGARLALSQELIAELSPARTRSCGSAAPTCSASTRPAPPRRSPPTPTSPTRPPHTPAVLRVLDQIRQRLPNDHLVVRVVFPAPGMPADRRRPTQTTMLGRLRVPIRRAAPTAGRRDTTMRCSRTHVRIMHLTTKSHTTQQVWYPAAGLPCDGSACPPRCNEIPGLTLRQSRPLPTNAPRQQESTQRTTSPDEIPDGGLPAPPPRPSLRGWVGNAASCG